MKNNKIILCLGALLATAPCFGSPYEEAHAAIKSKDLVNIVRNYDLLVGSVGTRQKVTLNTTAQKAGLGSIAAIRALLATSEILVKALVDAAQAYHSSASAATDVQYEEAYLAVKDKSLAVPPGTKAAFDAALAHAATQY